MSGQSLTDICWLAFGRNRLVTPFPRIDEGLRLRAVLAALVVVDLEVVALGIERRIDVAQIDALAGDLATQHIKVVAVE